MPSKGSDYNFSAKPDVLPTPPVTYSLSKPAQAVDKEVRALIPRVGLDDLRGSLADIYNTIATSGGDYEKVSREGQQEFAQGMVGAAKNIASNVKSAFTEPLGSQPWWDAAVRTGTDVLGASRILHGGEGGRIEGTGPIWRPKNFMGEPPPPTKVLMSYPLRSPPTREFYMNAFRKNLDAGDDFGARNVLRNASRDKVSLPINPNDMSKMGMETGREFWKHMESVTGRPPMRY